MTSTPPQIPFCKPDYGTGERENIERAISLGKLEGGGLFTKLCETQLEQTIGCSRALIVPSCTAALEIFALALDIDEGDEVIMPSFTFVSTANAIALRGGVPVFVDVDPQTLNIDPEAVRQAITSRTKAVMVVHYAGVSCDMEALLEICEGHDLLLLEDAAQAHGAHYKGKTLGSFGTFGAISFHHTKNITCGEGGALFINDENYKVICETIRDKGTNRADFLRGNIVKYEWHSLGSSFLLSELAAAVLDEQLKRQQELTEKRLAIWNNYHAALSSFQQVKTPVVPNYAGHNGHIYHLRLPDKALRDEFKRAFAEQNIVAAPHYVPLHLSPAGDRYGRYEGKLPNTIEAADHLIRLPLYSSMTDMDVQRVIDCATTFLTAHKLF